MCQLSDYRSKADAPKIDGNVFFAVNEATKLGDFTEVTITDSDTYDLYGELLE